MSLGASVSYLLEHFGVPVIFEAQEDRQTLPCFLKPRVNAGEAEYLHTVIGFEEGGGRGFSCVCPYLPEDKWEGCRALWRGKPYRVRALAGQVPQEGEYLYSTCTLAPETQ